MDNFDGVFPFKDMKDLLAEQNQPTDDFEAIWKIYPRKIAKGEARKAWKQTEKIRPPLSQLMKAIAVAKASDQWRQDGGIFIPYFSTWLRGERWDDCHEIDLGLVRDGKAWHETVSGVEARARELGIGEWTGEWEGAQETFQQYTKRVRAAFDERKVVKLKAA